MDLFGKEVIKSAFQVIVSPNSKWLVIICCGVVLFLPEKGLEVLGLAGIASEYKAAVGVAFLWACAVVVRDGFCFVVEKVKEAAACARVNRALKAMTEEQKELLRALTKEGCTCGLLPCDKECVQQMMDAGILIAVGTPFLCTVGRVERLRNYALHPLAREYFYGKLNG